MRDYFPELVEQQQTAVGVRRWSIAFLLWAMKWGIRFFWAMLLLLSVLFSLAVIAVSYSKWTTSPIEAAASALAGIMIAGIVAAVAIWGIRAARVSKTQARDHQP